MSHPQLHLVCEKSTLTYELEDILTITEGTVLESGYRLYDTFIRVDASFKELYKDLDLNEIFKREILAKA